MTESAREDRRWRIRGVALEHERLRLVCSAATRTAAWAEPFAVHPMALLGLGNTENASNMFPAKLNAALWTAIGYS